MPVLLFLPLWSILYVGTLELPARGETGLLGEGAEVYDVAAACSSCHGKSGEGSNSGPKLSEGELVVTFPEDSIGLGLAQQIEWVIKGTNGIGVGRPYGSNEQGRVGGWFGEMAGFGNSLTAEELIAVVLYERVAHGESETARTLAARMEELMAAGTLELPANFSQDTSTEEIMELLAPVFQNEEE